MKLLTAVLLLILTTVATSAQDRQPSSELLAEIVDGAEKNLGDIDTLAALYQVRSTSRHQMPRDGDVHFTWSPTSNRFRSRFVSSPDNAEAASPQRWQAIRPDILFGDGHRLLVDRFRDYLMSQETNERVVVTSSGEGEDMIYTIRIAYTNDSEQKLFVTWKISKKFGFNPLLVVSSLGVSPETAELRNVSSWTYRKVDAISVPEHVAISRFERTTGEFVSMLTLDLVNVKLNDPETADALDPQRLREPP